MSWGKLPEPERAFIDVLAELRRADERFIRPWTELPESPGAFIHVREEPPNPG